jgi:hypothetical protein
MQKNVKHVIVSNVPLIISISMLYISGNKAFDNKNTTNNKPTPTIGEF